MTISNSYGIFENAKVPVLIWKIQDNRDKMISP